MPWAHLRRGLAEANELAGEQECHGVENAVDEETLFSSLESSSSLEKLNQLYGRPLILRS